MKNHGPIKSNKIRTLLLSVVALVLVLVMVAGVSYSWIEDANSLRIVSDKDLATPLSSTSALDSTVLMDRADLTDGQPQYNAIDLGSYFYESGDMHLAPCSGDGTNFFFKKLGGVGTTGGYRKATTNDENTNYLSVTFKIKSNYSNVSFWFNELPKFSAYSKYARFSITVDGETRIYANCQSGGITEKVVTGADGATKSQKVYSAADYTYDSEKSNDDRVLFTVTARETKTVTVKIWLQDIGGSEVKSLDLKKDENGKETGGLGIDMVLCSSWVNTRTITIRDCSNNNSEWNWGSKDDAAMYLTLAERPEEFYTKLDWNGGNECSVTIPAGYRGMTVIILRCETALDSSGRPAFLYRNKGDGYGGGYLGYVQVENYKVVAWNYWVTDLPDSNDDSTFTIYGNSYDLTMTAIFGGTATAEGYGTWNEAVPIQVSNFNYSDDWIQGPDANDTYKRRLFVQDFSQDDAPKYPMLYNNGKWYTYIDKNSTKIGFKYYYLENGTKPVIYNRECNDSAFNGNERGLQQTWYKVSGSNGSWDTLDTLQERTIYFIRSGDSGTGDGWTVWAYLQNDSGSITNDTNTGDTLGGALMTDTGLTASNGAKIYSYTYLDVGYTKVKFNNNYGSATDALTLANNYGRYYDYATNQWYDTPDFETVDLTTGWYLRGSFNDWSESNQFMKANETDTVGSVTLHLTAGQHTFKVYYKNSTSTEDKDKWYGKLSTTVTREASSVTGLVNLEGSQYDITLEADKEGDYTFTYNLSTESANNSLTVTYP